MSEEREVMDKLTESHGYPVDEIGVAQYLAGHVNREDELILVRMGNDDGTIREAPMHLDEAQGVIEALQGNVIELTQVIDIKNGETGGVLNLLADVVGDAVTKSDFPVMQLLVEWIEASDNWPAFAKWASEFADSGELTDNGHFLGAADDGWTNGGT